MEQLKVVLIVFVAVIVARADIDPCVNTNEVKIVNHDVHGGLRSANVTTPTGSDLYCDRTIHDGWYMYLAPETGGSIMKTLEIPRRCVHQYHCGTKYPIWMDDTLPTPSEGIVSKKMCVSVTSCCTYAFWVKVRNCGNDVVAYRLVQSPGCPSAYCFGEHQPCPPPMAGFTPNCTPAPVELPIDPPLSLKNEDDAILSDIRFGCSMTLPSTIDQKLRLQVQWLANGVQIDEQESSGSVSGQTEFLLREWKLTYIDNHGRNVSHFGKLLTCRMRSFFTHGTYSQWRVSRESKFLGIKILNYGSTRVDLDEGEELELQLQLQVPYLGGMPLTIEVAVPHDALDGTHCATGEPIPQLAADTCGLSVARSQWKNIHRLKVKATVDNKKETIAQALRRINLRTPLMVWSHLIWNNYSLPEIEIGVKDKDNRRIPMCRSTNDPHMTTFDGVSYEHHLEGYFVLYRHKTYPFEVHAHYKPCNKGRFPMCNCAVGILSANDVIVFDKCGRGTIDVTSWELGRNRMRVAVRSAGLNRGTRILRENGGKKYRVQLPTGGEVIVDDSYSTFINLYVVASVMDRGESEGLCSSFDENCANDLIPRHQTLLPPGYSTNCGRAGTRYPLAFSESWRINETESLLHWNWNFEDDRQSSYDGHVYCTCAEDDQSLSCVAGGDAPKCKPRYGQKDETNRLLGNARRRRNLARHDHFDFLDYDETEYMTVTKTTKNKKRNRRTTRTFSEEEALRYCDNYVRSTNVALQCGALDIDFTEPIESCALDLVATGDTQWAVTALDTVKHECLAEVDRNTSLWVQTPTANVTVPPVAIEGAICYNECSGNGICDKGECSCHQGYAAPDCSVDLNSPPDVYFTPRCDVSTRPCLTNPVIGNDFLEGDSLTCHIKEVGINSNGLYVGVNPAQVNTMAQFESYGEVTCPLPSASDLTMTRSPGEALAFKVSVSNNGVLTSNEVLMVIHDSRCHTCNITTERCQQTTNSCIIDGGCYVTGTTEPTDSCRVCDPIRSQSSWSPSTDASCLPTTPSTTATSVPLWCSQGPNSSRYIIVPGTNCHQFIQEIIDAPDQTHSCPLAANGEQLQFNTLTCTCDWPSTTTCARP